MTLRWRTTVAVSSGSVCRSLSGDGTNVTGLTRSEEPLLKKTVELVDDEEQSSTNTTILRRGPAAIDQIGFSAFATGTGRRGQTMERRELPSGVEVSLGTEPLPEETTPTNTRMNSFAGSFSPTHSTSAPS